MGKAKNVFIIIGAQRSGTTYLYKVLEEHPEICLAKPYRPEPKFFLEQEFDYGPDYYFEKYFSHQNSMHKIFGEKSTTYYESKIAPKRIANYFPSAKILLLIRNPIDRAISNYFFSKSNNLEMRSLEDVFLIDKPSPSFPSYLSTNPFEYLKRGHYISFIKKYLKYFKRENIHISIFEKTVGKIEEIKKIYSFLEVNEQYNPKKLNKKINSHKINSPVSKEIRDKLEHYFNSYNNELNNFLKEKIY